MKIPIKHILFIVSILVYAFSIRFIVKDKVVFHADSARDLFIVDSMRDGQYFPSIGHENIIGYNVPVYYYLIYFASFITGTGFANLQWFFIIWTLTGLIFLYFLFQEFGIPSWLSALVTVAFSSTFSIMGISLEIWSVNLVFTLGILFFYLLYKAVTKNNLLLSIYAFIPLFLALSIDLSLSILFPIGFFWLYKIKTQKAIKIIFFTILITTACGFILWWISVNAQAQGGYNQYWQYLLLILSLPTNNVPTLKDLIRDYFSGSLWIDNVISQIVWVMISLFYFLLYFRKNVKNQFDLKYINSFIVSSMSIIFLFYFFIHKIYIHYLFSIYFIQILILTLVWRYYGNFIKLLLLLYIIAFLIFSTEKYIKRDYGYSYYKHCLNVAKSIEKLSQNRPFGFIYYDVNGLQEWETTKYYYCLKQIGIQESITVFGGSFTDNFNSPLYHQSSKIPETTFLLCISDQLNLCISKFHKQFRDYIYYIYKEKYEINGEDLTVIKYVKAYNGY